MQTLQLYVLIICFNTQIFIEKSSTQCVCLLRDSNPERQNLLPKCILTTRPPETIQKQFSFDNKYYLFKAHYAYWKQLLTSIVQLIINKNENISNNSTVLYVYTSYLNINHINMLQIKKNMCYYAINQSYANKT